MGTDQPCDFGADLLIVEHLVSYQGMFFVIFTGTDHHWSQQCWWSRTPWWIIVLYSTVHRSKTLLSILPDVLCTVESFNLAIALRKCKQLGVRKHVCSYSPYSMIQSASGRIGLIKRYMSEVPVKNYPESGWQNVSCTLPLYSVLITEEFRVHLSPSWWAKGVIFTRSSQDSGKSIHPGGHSGVKTELKAF